ncbi:MAG: MarR family transcriptional regulator [Chloroflexi bacterium]|nr:MarR family transcriptional regulator [Chloroflexota bacterium]
MTGSNEVSAFAAQLHRLLYRLAKNCNLCDQTCIGQFGVTASQGYTLLAVPEDGNVSMNELSETMGLASSTMTRMADQLVGKGLVHRRPDDEDRRVVRVGLTSQGREVRCTLEQALQEFFKQVLGEIQADEQLAMLQVLEKVNSALTKAQKARVLG